MPSRVPLMKLAQEAAGISVDPANAAESEAQKAIHNATKCFMVPPERVATSPPADKSNFTAAVLVFFACFAVSRHCAARAGVVAADFCAGANGFLLGSFAGRLRNHFRARL